eukprot:3714926-Pyramimonas_sp.AAC.1
MARTISDKSMTTPSACILFTACWLSRRCRSVIFCSGQATFWFSMRLDVSLAHVFTPRLEGCCT